MSDITLDIKVKRHPDVDWVATTQVYGILGSGKTPEIAIGNFTSALEELYTGDKFLAAGNKSVRIGYEITGVSAKVYLNVQTDRSLDEFGVGAPETPEPIFAVVDTDTQAPAIEGQEILAPSEPETENDQPTCSTCANWDMLENQDNTGECRPRPGYWSAGYCLACTDYVPRAEEEGETPSPAPDPIGGTRCASCKHRIIKEGRLGMHCGHPDQTDERVVFGFTRGCGRYEAGDGANALRDAFGISLDRQEIAAIADGTQTRLIMPSMSSNIAQGDRMIVYERGKGGGRKSYVGEFVVGEKIGMEREDAWDAEWQQKLNADREQIAEKFGNDLRRFAVEILAYQEYTDPVAVPYGWKAPRGVNWISPSHLETIFQEV